MASAHHIASDTRPFHERLCCSRWHSYAVHAKDDAARAFHERFDFERSPTDPYHLLLLMKNVRALLAR